MTEKLERDFWLKIKETRKYSIEINNIKKKNLEKQESTRKIIKLIKICLENTDILEGACELYKRYKVIRISCNFILKYYISTFKKYNKNT